MLMAPTSINRLLGHHITADFFDCQCPIERLRYRENGLKLLYKIEKYITPLGIQSHQFEPFSYSAILMLAESHVSIHTWTEYNFVSLDFFTCNGIVPENIYQLSVDFYSPQRIGRNDIRRGILPD